MKVYLRVVLLWAMVVSLVAVPGMVQAQDGTIYVDPQGRFTVEIPAGWADQSTDQYGLFVNPDNVGAYLLAVAADELQPGIQAGLAIIVPGFDTPPLSSNDLPLPNGIWTQNIYLGTGAGLNVALGHWQDGVVYLVYLTIPDQNLLQGQAQADMNSILLGFTIGAKIDLAGVKPAVLDADKLAEIDAYLASEFEKSGIPGAAIAIVQDGQIIYTRGLGVREVGTTGAVSDQTLFMIGSTTKSMTTLTAATLVDDEVIGWDEPVTEIVPDFALSDPAATPKIRVRDLFNMSSGLPRYDMTLLLDTPTPEELIASLADIPLVAQPGEQFNYNNQIVASGGYILALAAGAERGVNVYDTYKDLLQTRVFDRVGMTSSTIDFDAATSSADHALPHTNDLLTGNEITVPLGFERFVVPETPAGGVWSTAQDMGRYLIMELQRGVAADGTRVVSEAALLATQTPAIATGGSSSYGMGWMIEDYQGQTLIEHGGGTSGFTCDFSFLPDAGLGVVILMNRTEGEMFGLAARSYIYETAFGLEHHFTPTYTTIVDTLRQQMTVSVPDPASVQDYLGQYEHHVTLSVNAQGEVRIANVNADAPLLATGQPGVYVTGGGIPGLVVQFGTSDQGVKQITFSSEVGSTDGLILAQLSSQ